MHDNRPIRVRMAPSPTGYLHLGGLRTALFNWLFAHRYTGKFLLRIEDTDLERSKAEYTASILESLEWAGITHDEPLVIQSQHIKRHQEVAQMLIDTGKAYRCYCTVQELESRMGSNASVESGYAQYDRTCCDAEHDASKPFAIRFKIPDTIDRVSFNDLIHGEISFETKQLDDFIIIRSDGTPMYNFVVVVDDADMRITQVIRGDDHISNTPKQLLLYQACGFTVPQFAHVPMILGADGQRLSKRHAATAVIDYRKNGYLADALCNYLVRLGWSHGDQEIFTREELVNLFSLEHVGKKAAIFDSKKLDWINGLYIRQKSGAELLSLIIADVEPGFTARVPNWNNEKISTVIDLYKDRVKTLCELADELILLYTGPREFIDSELEKINKISGAKEHVIMLEQLLCEQEEFTAPALAELIKRVATEKNIKLPDIAQPLRVALVGKTASPGIFELLEILTKEESMKRLGFFLKTM